MFTELDAHFFALRQLSTSLLAFSIFFLFRVNYRLAGLLLGFFSLSIVSNLFISLSLIASFWFGQYFFYRQKIIHTIEFITTYLLVTVSGYLLLFFIPNSFDNLIRYQLDRSFTPYIARVESIKSIFLSHNWPLMVFGFIGSILINKKFGILGLFNMLSLLCIIFIGSSYFQHYLAILSIGLSISAGLLVSCLNKSTLLIKFLLVFIVLIVLYKTSLPRLKSALIDNTTPEFFRISSVLRDTPPPLFTFQPIYGLYNQKELTFHYNVADMRYFTVVGQNLDEQIYTNIINRSNTVLLVPSDYLSLPDSILKNLNKQFKLIYDQDSSKIYVRINRTLH